MFFVSFGQAEAGHDFDEAVYSNGIVRWQSQPAQTLATPMIQKLVEHNHLENDILLFLRTKLDGPYMFMGFLKYVSHDRERERPVHFQWKILEFDPTKDYESLLGLRLESVPGAAAIDIPEQRHAAQTLIAVPAPPAESGVKGVPIVTADFVAPLSITRKGTAGAQLGVAGETWRLPMSR